MENYGNYSLAAKHWADLPFMENFKNGTIYGGLRDYVDSLECELIASYNQDTVDAKIGEIIDRAYNREELYTSPIRFSGKSPNYPDIENIAEEVMCENYDIISRLAEVDTCYNCCCCENKEECWGKDPLTFSKFLDWPSQSDEIVNQVEDCLCSQESSTYEYYCYNYGLDSGTYEMIYDVIEKKGYAMFLTPWQLSDMIFNGTKAVVTETARKIIRLNDCQRILLPSFSEDTMFGCSPEAKEYRLAITG